MLCTDLQSNDGTCFALEQKPFLNVYTLCMGLQFAHTDQLKLLT